MPIVQAGPTQSVQVPQVGYPERKELNKYLRVFLTGLITFSSAIGLSVLGLTTGYWLDPGLSGQLGIITGIIGAIFWSETE